MNNKKAPFRLSAVHKLTPDGTNPSDQLFLVRPLNTTGTSDTFQIGTFRGTSLSDTFTSLHAFHDLVNSFTNSDYANTLEAAFGFSIEFTTGLANQPGEIFITDVGDIWGLKLDVWDFTGTSTITSGTTMNALITKSV
jgi:hypothetical protein